MTDTERTDGMAKAYDPSQVEGPLYEAWLEGGYFRARIDPDKEPFCIIMPPPNVTGELHLGGRSRGNRDSERGGKAAREGGSVSA